MLNGGKGVLHVDTWGTFGTRTIDEGGKLMRDLM